MIAIKIALTSAIVAAVIVTIFRFLPGRVEAAMPMWLAFTLIVIFALSVVIVPVAMLWAVWAA